MCYTCSLFSSLFKPSQSDPLFCLLWLMGLFLLVVACLPGLPGSLTSLYTFTFRAFDSIHLSAVLPQTFILSPGPLKRAWMWSINLFVVASARVPPQSVFFSSQPLRIPGKSDPLL